MIIYTNLHDCVCTLLYINIHNCVHKVAYNIVVYTHSFVYTHNCI